MTDTETEVVDVGHQHSTENLTVIDAVLLEFVNAAHSNRYSDPDTEQESAHYSKPLEFKMQTSTGKIMCTFPGMSMVCCHFTTCHLCDDYFGVNYIMQNAHSAITWVFKQAPFAVLS